MQLESHIVDAFSGNHLLLPLCPASLVRSVLFFVASVLATPGLGMHVHVCA